jgi:hypothetical protein
MRKDGSAQEYRPGELARDWQVVRSIPNADTREPLMHQHDQALAVQMLDLLLEFFRDDACWMRGHYHDGDRRRCLMGALDHLQRNHHISYAGAVHFLQQALPSRQSGLVNFNDRLCKSLAELRSVIMKARALALGMQRWRLPPRQWSARSWRNSNAPGLPKAGARLPYSITSSARISIDCGTVRPSSLAVLRLMTSSNRVGCSTGRSAGLAPLRILPT